MDHFLVLEPLCPITSRFPYLRTWLTVNHLTGIVCGSESSRVGHPTGPDRTRLAISGVIEGRPYRSIKSTSGRLKGSA